MQHEKLGLFDTPPNRNEVRAGLTVVFLIFLGFVLILPLSAVPLRESNAFVPVVNVAVLAGDLIIATMLFAQATVFRSRALMALGSGFVFIAVLLVPYVLAFPGAFAPDGLLGAGTNSAAWIMIFRRLSFPLMIMLYVMFWRLDSTEGPELERPLASAILWAAAAVALAMALSALAIVGHDALPQIFRGRSEGIYAHLLIFNFTNIALIIVAIAMLWRKRSSVLDVWLMVALAGWLIQSVLNLSLQERFTVGWYSLHLIILISNLTVLLALIAESNRLYARLALSVAARGREREARMMSMDAMAAAMAQEVGQPLAAVSLSARAALNCLTGEQPMPEKAIQALEETIDAGHRTFEALNSVRAMFAKDSGSVCEVDINELVRETILLLDRELASQRIWLQLDLDSSLPPILANRVQLKRVLINLLTNAIESVGMRRRARRIAIRSAAVEGRKLLLEVSDSGAGIPPQDLERIFEPFFTNKRTGAGLGLSLSRTFAEENGGRLWATSENDRGATLHLQLPLRTLP
ncbi:MAG TPA: MASE4 domain-containing protein [Sphingomicrobium sp.]|nr:MASE4 domain-containing protein [Sphingomicrobium sp.]